MHTPEIQMPQAGRRRGRYSDEFKRRVIAACLELGVSTAAIAAPEHQPGSALGGVTHRDDAQALAPIQQRRSKGNCSTCCTATLALVKY